MFGNLLRRMRGEQSSSESRYDVPRPVRPLRSQASRQYVRTIRRYVEHQRRNWTPQSNQLSS